MSSDSKGRKKKHHKKHGHWKVFLLSVLVVAAVLTLVIRLATRTVTMKLNGDSEVTVEVGSFYDEKGATASYGHQGFALFRNLPVAVSISGNVDASVIGEYTVTYKAIHGSTTQELTRKVRVADTQPPVISLKTQDGYYTPIGKEYEEEGFEAMDAYDGDLTDKVVREELGDGTIRYSVKDSAGNEAVMIRTIPYDDRTVPVITLEGTGLHRDGRCRRRYHCRSCGDQRTRREEK